MGSLTKRFVFACIGACAATGSANAVTYPYKLHQEQNIDTHQVGWIDLTIDAQGQGSLTDSWSNGKQISGNTFYSIVVFVGKDGKPIYANKQTKGIDGSYGGHAREGHVTTSFTLTKEQMDAFDHVALKMGAMNCGIQLSSFHCCDNGIEVGFSGRPCNVPAVPHPPPPHANQAR
jgi:hypothetical protein